MKLVGGVALQPAPPPCSARCRMLGIGRPRPFAWQSNIAGSFKNPVSRRYRRAARIVCAKDSSSSREGASRSAAAPEAGTKGGDLKGLQGRERGKMQQQRGAKTDTTGSDLLADVKLQYKQLRDKVYYGDVLPPVGHYQLSYARLLELLARRRVKRLVLLGDGRTALVEIPVENTESNVDTIKYNRRDLSIMYAEEYPEWVMEKNRYYCELPGDVWEEGTLMELIKANQEKRVMMNGAVRVPYDSLLEINQVRPELQVMDPGDALVWLNQYVGQFLPIAGLLALRVVVGGGEWALRKLGREKKSEQEELADQLGSHKAREFNVQEGGKKGGKKRDTGVRYSDVAGIDHIKSDIQEILDILLGKGEYKEMGANPIRGVLLEGPPGTGKTLLAKAMAGEAGIPFYSANGAEFVEMFQGVAAARIRSLFKAARNNSPSIIFIDEIDAIGKARSDHSADSGTQEREQGLLQMLTEMDGFVRDDEVLVIGATNRASALDDALLRPGRFDRSIYMGRPTPANRLKVLQVHARNKPISRDNDDELLRQVAKLAIGYSGAELANLLNEGAILAVRKEKPEIDLPILIEAMDKMRLGLPHTSLPDTPAKRRYAMVEAARVVAFALTPGLPPIEQVTIRPRGGKMARIIFVPQALKSDGGLWNRLGWGPGQQQNAVQLDRPLTQFELVCELMVPLYVPRACEELLYGKDGVSLSTSKEVSAAAEVARWVVVDSKLHPLNRNKPVMGNLQMGAYEDPTTEWMDQQYDDYILALQRVAYEKALQLVEQRRPVIEQIGQELCENRDETVLGARVVELLQTTPLAASPLAEEAAAMAATISSDNGEMSTSERSVQGSSSSSNETIEHQHSSSRNAPRHVAGKEVAEEELGDEILRDEQMRRLAEVVMGRIDNFDLLPTGFARTKAQQVKEQLLDPDTRHRLESIQQFVSSENGASFPKPPEVPVDKGVLLDEWTPKQSDTLNV